MMRVRSWYSLEAEIDVEEEVWHRVRVDGVPLNHPPLVNLVLRQGLSSTERHRLSFLHEFGHFQTLPLAIVHSLVLYRASPKPVSFLRKIIWWLTFAVTHQVFWEIASEGYVVALEREDYMRAYRQKPNLLMPIFWGVMGGVGFWLHLWLVHKSDQGAS
jgi:hypothetical protein